MSTTCFKKLQNNPLWGFKKAEEKPDRLNVLKTRGENGAQDKPVTKAVTKTATKPLGTEKVEFGLISMNTLVDSYYLCSQGHNIESSF